MINANARQLIEPNLKPREQILWAEKVDDVIRKKWVEKSAREARIWAIPGFLFGTFIIWTTVSISPHPETKPWVVALASILPITFGCFFLYASFLSFKSFFGTVHFENQRPYKFYVLTNFRLLYFDANGDILIERDACNVKSASLLKRWYFPNKWKSLCLMLSPIGSGVWKMSEIYFLPDFENSKNHILSVINAKD